MWISYVFIKYIQNGNELRLILEVFECENPNKRVGLEQSGSHHHLIEN
jgi:hypothetical protein